MTTIAFREEGTDVRTVEDSHHVVYELYGVRVEDGKGGHTLYPWDRVHSVTQTA